MEWLEKNVLPILFLIAVFAMGIGFCVIGYLSDPIVRKRRERKAHEKAPPE